MQVLAVGAGGFLGAVMRYWVGGWIQTRDGFPFGTLVINLLGCLFLSWFLTITMKKWKIDTRLKLIMGTGFTGAFTTFSTFSVENIHLLQSHLYLWSILYILSSVIGGIVLALLGVKIANLDIVGLKRAEGDTE